MTNITPQLKEEFKNWFKLWRPFFFQRRITLADMNELEDFICSQFAKLIDEASQYEPSELKAAEMRKQLREKWL